MQPEAAARQRRVRSKDRGNQINGDGTDFHVWPLRSIREDEGVDSTRSAYFLEARGK
jgi:hypothetical protein